MLDFLVYKVAGQKQTLVYLIIHSMAFCYKGHKKVKHQNSELEFINEGVVPISKPAQISVAGYPTVTL